MENLKVGQSFEVVEITEHCDYKAYGDSYKLGGHTLLTDNWMVLENGVDSNGYYYAFLSHKIPKKIGKLTIKSLKQC